MNTYRSSRYILNIILMLLALVNEYPCDTTVSENMVKIKAVKDRILNGYDKLVRPIKKDSNTTEVRLGFGPRQIIDVDETNGMFVLDSYIWLHWNDSRLQWDKADYDGTLAFPQDMIWLPDISVYNSHSLTVNPSSETLTYIVNDGSVYWGVPMLTQTSCESIMDAVYPYDEVECNIILGSWAHDGWHLNFNYNQMYPGYFLNIHSRWELFVDRLNVTHNVYVYESEPYYEFTYSFPLKRRPVPEIEATRVPCILVMILTLSVFWMAPNSSKKVLVLGIQFLILTGLIIYVASSTKFAVGVLFATTFLQSTMYLVVTTFLLQILIIFNLCNLSGPARPPPLAMQLLSGPFGKYACLRWPLNNDLPLDRVQLKEDSSATLESPTPREDWNLFAAGLDRIFFVLVAIAMISIHHL